MGGGRFQWGWADRYVFSVDRGHGWTQSVVFEPGDGTFQSYFDPIAQDDIDNNSAWAVGDFNGDGRTDIYFVWTGGTDGRNRLYLSQGDGTFDIYEDPLSRGEIDNDSAWAVGDYNGDGRTDIYFLWTGGNNGTNRLYLSRGDGTFEKYEDPLARGEIDNDSGWAVGDFNGDGRTDMYFLWTDGTDGRNRLYLSQGNGTFNKYSDPISQNSI